MNNLMIRRVSGEWHPLLSSSRVDIIGSRRQGQMSACPPVSSCEHPPLPQKSLVIPQRIGWGENLATSRSGVKILSGCSSPGACLCCSCPSGTALLVCADAVMQTAPGLHPWASGSQVLMMNVRPGRSSTGTFHIEGGGNQGIPYKIQELQEQEWGS